jgi:hypothetical protein
LTDRKRYRLTLHREVLDREIYDTASPRADSGAWDIIRAFATSEMTLPEAEERLKKHLGERYNTCDWHPALDAVMDAEDDTSRAQEAIHHLASKSQLPRLVIKLPRRLEGHESSVSQIVDVEKELMSSVEELVKRKRIIGCPPTFEELVNPIEEREVGDSPYRFEGGDAEIVAEVWHEIAVARGEVIELDDSDSEDEGDDSDDAPSRQELIKLCEKLEKACFRYGGEDFSLELPRQLHKYRAQLLHEDLCSSTQTSLTNYFTPKYP